MAFTQMEARSDGSGRPTYNIDRAVGYGAPCNRTDTMLVQALFHIFFYEQEGCFTANHAESGYYFTPPAGYSSIAIDGYIGPATRSHIAAFQQGLAQLGHLNRVDHRLDPMRESVYKRSTITRVHYTLAWLNVTCANRAHQQGQKPAYDNLGQREDMPMQLRNALKTRKQLADQYRFR